METTIDVVEDEDCNKTVDKIPTMRPAIGFVFSPKSAPALHEVMTFEEFERSSNPTKKRTVNEVSNVIDIQTQI